MKNEMAQVLEASRWVRVLQLVEPLSPASGRMRCAGASGSSGAGPDAAKRARDVKPETCVVETMPLSHELRTPLNAILGNIELLLDGSAGPLSPQARACLADIQAASQHLMQQTHSLLLLVQALAAPAIDDSTPVDLLERFRQTLHTGRSWHGAGRLDVKPGDARLVLQGDPFWLDALVAATFELFRAGAAAGGALRLALESRRKGNAGVRVMRVTWHSFDPARLPAAPLQLIVTIVRMHGGEVEKAEGGGLDLCWPRAREVQS